MIYLGLALFVINGLYVLRAIGRIDSFLGNQGDMSLMLNNKIFWLQFANVFAIYGVISIASMVIFNAFNVDWFYSIGFGCGLGNLVVCLKFSGQEDMG